MFEKLQEVEKRYEEVNELICKPEIIADMEQYTKLMKENKHLEPVVEKFREYKKTKKMAMWACVISSVVMGIVAAIVNYFILLPLFETFSYSMHCRLIS